MSADLERITAFALELDGLKRVERRTRPRILDRPENSAEHSWHVCLLAMALLPEAEPPVDAARVVELLLVHDVPEIDAGDQLVYRRAPAERRTAERRGAERVFGLLPPDRAARFLARWEEFEARETPEARYAYAMDRLMPLLHNLDAAGRGWREHGVVLEQVLALNAPIGEACPRVWERVRRRIEEAAAAGAFDSDGRGPAAP
ncbi:MAG: HD domain-containing protein [Hyphomicrobiales bacterium]